MRSLKKNAGRKLFLAIAGVFVSEFSVHFLLRVFLRDASEFSGSIANASALAVVLLPIFLLIFVRPLAKENRQLESAIAERTQHLEELTFELTSKSEALEQANVIMQVAARRFEQLFQGLPTPCFAYDRDGIIHDWNQAAAAQYQLKSEDVFLQPIWSAVCLGEHLVTDRDAIDRALTGEKVMQYESVHRASDGKEIPVLCSSFPIIDARGKINGGITAAVDITNQKENERRINENLIKIQEMVSELQLHQEGLREANEKLQKLATTDGMTGLLNHRAFQERFQERFFQAHSRDGQLALALLDIDHFKDYNDTFGHPAGDAVLRDVATVIDRSLPKYSYVARYGGEEFVIVFPDSNLDEAVLYCEKIRKAISSTEFANRIITCSLGVVDIQSHPFKTAGEMIQHADLALYGAKRAGRNRVMAYQSEQDRAA